MKKQKEYSPCSIGETSPFETKAVKQKSGIVVREPNFVKRLAGTVLLGRRHTELVSKETGKPKRGATTLVPAT